MSNSTTFLIDSYLAAYGESDKTTRSEVVRGIWAEDGQLVDPPLTAQGHTQIIDQADALLSQFPGHRFMRSSGIDTHHGWSRYGWQLLDTAGQVALEGCDFAQVDDNGKLTQVVGFFGPLPMHERMF